MQFIFEQVQVGGDRNFGYLIGDREAKVGVLIDPAYNPEKLIERAKAQELKIEYILNTHGHGDHTNGNAKAKKLTGAKVAGIKESGNPDVVVKDGGELKVGAFTLKILHVPGHCSDHIVVHLPEQEVAITGDLLFVGKIGGTSSDEDARVEWNSLKRVLGELTDATTIWPGHDYGCRPSTSVALEKRCNPFLQCEDIKAFIQLKNDWPIFKAQNGLK